MPHPENRPAARVSPDLVAMRVWQVIESDLRIAISCDSCHHKAVWTRGFMEKRLRKFTAFTVFRLASRLRCGGCRSHYIEVSRLKERGHLQRL